MPVSLKISICDIGTPFYLTENTLAVCFAPANGAAPSFMLERSDTLIAWWFFGTTTAARWVLLFCLSGLPPALSAEPHLLFEVVLFVVSCPFKAAAAAGRVGTQFADKLPLILGFLLCQLFLFRWPKNHWVSTRQAALCTCGEFTFLTEPVV